MDINAQHIRNDIDLEDLYLIAMSGYCRLDDMKKSKEAGFDKHLGKPLDLKLLKELIDELAII